MELPPSGWYPDPYRVPGLLRWWDGSTWTHHTHATGGADATDSAGPGAAAAAGAAGAQQTTVQPAVRPTTVQPAVQPTTVQPAVQPSGRHARVQPTTVQPSVQHTAVQPTTVQPTTVQPTTVQPAGARAAFTPPQGPGPGAGQDGNGTQVLFLGDDAWTTPGGPGGPDQDSRFGYLRAQRRRRMWLMAGLVGGTAAALGVVALVVNNLGNSHPAVAASKPPTKPVAATTAPPTPAPSPTPSPTPTPLLLTDGVSGLSYTELPDWQPNCPTGLTNQAFTWSAGESTIVQQINGGQTAWYGVACSGPLPQSYGYNGVANLESSATNLANTFNNSYYAALAHGFQQQFSGPVTISGHAGWEIKYLITYNNAQSDGLKFADEEGAVVVADLGTGVAPAVFYVSVPHNLGESKVDSLVSSLQLSVPAQPGGGGSPGDGSPNAGGSPDAVGSPAP